MKTDTAAVRARVQARLKDCTAGQWSAQRAGDIRALLAALDKAEAELAQLRPSLPTSGAKR